MWTKCPLKKENPRYFATGSLNHSYHTDMLMQSGPIRSHVLSLYGPNIFNFGKDVGPTLAKTCTKTNSE